MHAYIESSLTWARSSAPQIIDFEKSKNFFGAGSINKPPQKDIQFFSIFIADDLAQTLISTNLFSFNNHIACDRFG